MPRRRAGASSSGVGRSFAGGLGRSDLARVDRGWGLARPRDLLRGMDSESPWRAWRLGLRLADEVGSVTQAPVLPARLLHLDPTEPAGTLVETPAALVAWPSEGSPTGRWTVTVLPRGAIAVSGVLSEANQQDVTVRWRELNALGRFEDRSWRLLRVETGPLYATGIGLESDLVGELVEDSLMADGGWRPDDTETRLRMVVAVDGTAGVVWLDGEREWRRQRIEPVERGQPVRWRLTERKLIPEESILMAAGMRLVQSTTVACNCPQALGMVLRDWRSQGGVNDGIIGGALAPGGVDPVSQVAKRFKTRGWERNPMVGCKHEHATRFLLGVPVAEPKEMLTLVNDYWKDRRAFLGMEGPPAPMAGGEFVEGLRRSSAIDAAWGALDPLVETIGAADAVSVSPQEEALPARVLVPPSTAPGQGLADPQRRFHRSWYDVRSVLTEQAQLGDVWLGRGGQRPEPLLGPGESAQEPFLLRTYGDQAEIRVLP